MQNPRFNTHVKNGARLGVVCVLHLAFCISTAPPAFATVLLPAEFTMVVNEAGTIVHGRVVDVSSHLTGPQRLIESVVTVHVIESLKGSSSTGGTVSFRVPNGQVGRYRRIIVGAPEFSEGEEVVVFLRLRAPAIPTLYGLSQGVYRVRRNGVARAVVIPAPVTAQGIGAERVVRGDPARTPMPVESFVRHVRAILESRQ
jgi:hypothetical protein